MREMLSRLSTRWRVILPLVAGLAVVLALVWVFLPPWPTFAWAWGENGNGQLGDGTTSDRRAPVLVQILARPQAIAAGVYHNNLALENFGTVRAWGSNSSGQLGDGTTTDRSAPVQVQNLRAVSAIAGGGLHSLALESDGVVRAWGYNGYGQL